MRTKLHLEKLEDRLAPTTGLSASNQALLQSYGQLPISFEANVGQTDSQVQYLAHGSGYGLFLAATAAVLNLQTPTAPPSSGQLGLSSVSVLGSSVSVPNSTTSDATGVALAMNLIGANSHATVNGQDQLPGTSNYFIGNDPSQWHTGIANYGQVEYQGVYPGVNLVYYGNQKQLEYDFTVAPGADPGIIRLGFQGADSISLDDQGNLVVSTALGDILQHAPVVYQGVDGTRQAVAGQFVLLGQNEVGFQVGAYDTNLPLTIDPVLSYSTYLGGNKNDGGNGIAVDGSGNAYITGYTESNNFPITTGAYRTSHANDGGQEEPFVTKLNATGTALIYSTYLGGNGYDYANSIAVDGSGNAYVTGFAGSTNFPTTAGAFQTIKSGNGDAFVTKLNATGTALIYSTYLGGSGGNGCRGDGIALDGSGNAYVVGHTDSADFPTTTGAFQTSYAGGDPTSYTNGFDAFVTKLNATGTALLYSTYLGGSGDDLGTGIAVDGFGSAYVTGYTTSSDFPTTTGVFQTINGGAGNGNSEKCFVAKLNADGSALIYSTYLGGSYGSSSASSIEVDSSGNAYVTGATGDADFPVTTGAFQAGLAGNGDAFVTKLNADGTALIYSTYLGGSQFTSSTHYTYNEGIGIAVDGLGNAYITGATASTNFPTTTGAYQTSYGGSFEDAFVTKLNAAGTALIYSTYLGGNNDDYGAGIALDGFGNAYIAGYTGSTNFPTTAGAYRTSLGGGAAGTDDAFAAKFIFNIVDTSTTVGATVSGSPVAIVSYGTPVTLTATVVAASGSNAPTAGSVTFKDGTIFLGTAFTEIPSGTSAVFTLITSANLLQVIQSNGGNHTITASYLAPGSNFTSSTGTLGGGLAVTPAPLTITATTNTKTYDATTIAAAKPIVTGLLGSDTVVDLRETYDTANVGTGKTLLPAGLIIDGNNGSNYVVTFVSNTTGEIDVGPFSKFVVNVLGGNSVIAGGNFLYTVQATDAFGNPVSSYSGATTVTTTPNPADPQSIFPNPGTLNGSGFGYFLGTLKTAGSYTLSTASGTFSGASGIVTVVPSYADYFAVNAPPAAITGTSSSVTVTVYDHYGNVVPGYTGTVKLASTDSAAFLGGAYTFTTGAGQDNGVHTFNVMLNTCGNQTVSLADTTSTTPSITGTSSVITTRGLTVTSLTPTPNGFTINFNKPFVPADLTLYGANVSAVDDVVMTGNNGVGPIHGSLIIDPTNQSLTFKATSSYLGLLNSQKNGNKSVVLPDAIYTVKLISGSNGNGFLDALGAGLDGANAGGHANYTTTFTTSYQANATPVLGVPDFARGPDSNTPIQVPTSSQGIPLILYNAAGVTEVTFSLTYNPALLNITGTLSGSNSDATDSFSHLTLLSNAGGVAAFDYFDIFSQAATASQPLILGDIAAVVPSGTGAAALGFYQAKELLQIGSIVINGNQNSTVLSANGVHVNVYSGDVNADAVIDGRDTLAADSLAQGHGTGFAAFTLLDPVIVGDVAGDFSVDAGDVAAINSYVVKLQPLQIPTTPTQLDPTNSNYLNPNSIHSPNAADPTLSLVTRGLTTLGSPLVSVMIDHPDPEGSTGLSSVTLALIYDPAMLSVSLADITLGSLPNQSAGWQISWVVDQARGQIGIQLYSLTPITVNQAGSLVNIAFHTVSGATIPTTAVQLVNAATPNGQWFGTGVADSQGGMILSPGVDRLLVPTGAEGASLANATSPDNLNTTVQANPQVLIDALTQHDSQETGETTALLAKSEYRDEPQPVAAASLWLPVNGATQPLGQSFQIGNLPLLNSLLFQNSPGAQSADRLFLALVRSADDASDPHLVKRSFSSLIWDASPGLDWLEGISQLPAVESEAPPVIGTMIRQGACHRSEVDRSVVMDQLFADPANEGDDFGDLGAD